MRTFASAGVDCNESCGDFKGMGRIDASSTPIYIAPMEKHFASLEEKIDRVIGQCDNLRAENQRLRQELILKVDEIRILNERVEEARHRLQQLIAQVPD
jgi:cell division protein ZapB